jgi:hypothetical protein
MDAAVLRFVAAVCAVLAGCAIASEPRLATDGGDVDSGEAPDRRIADQTIGFGQTGNGNYTLTYSVQ